MNIVLFKLRLFFNLFSNKEIEKVFSLDPSRNYHNKSNLFTFKKITSFHLSILCLISSAFKSQDYHKENNSRHLKKISVNSKQELTDPSLSTCIYIAEGTILTGFSEHVSSLKSITSSNSKSSQKKHKSLKLKKEKFALTIKIKQLGPSTNFRTSNNERLFFNHSNQFPIAVILNNDHCNELSAVLKTEYLHLAAGFGINALAERAHNFQISISVVKFYSIRPPPVANFTTNLL